MSYVILGYTTFSRHANASKLSLAIWLNKNGLCRRCYVSTFYVIIILSISRCKDTHYFPSGKINCWLLPQYQVGFCTVPTMEAGYRKDGVMI